MIKEIIKIVNVIDNISNIDKISGNRLSLIVIEQQLNNCNKLIDNFITNIKPKDKRIIEDLRAIYLEKRIKLLGYES